MKCKEPAKTIPKSLLPAYTMNGNVKVFKMYYNNSVSQHLHWPNAYITKFIRLYTWNNIRHNRHLPESYRNASLFHCQAFNKYPVKNKCAAVIGSLTPWIEAILINYGVAAVTTVEYNVPQCNHNKISTLSYSDFQKQSQKYDIIVTYSSIEHSGLGRYGDPLDPNGDLKTMETIREHLKPEGLLFWGAPVGRDALCWNAHRIYGSLRLAKIFKGFKELDWFGVSRGVIDKLPYGKFNQPVVVLRNIAPTLQR